MRAIAIITARGGSKRIPRKNLRAFLGKPIIAYSIAAALESGLFDEVMVSTEDAEIAALATALGASVPFMRSAENASDHATTKDVLLEVIGRYAERGIIPDIACCIYPTAPFVTAEKLIAAFERQQQSGADTVLPIARFSFPIWRSFRKETDRISYNWPEFAPQRSQDVPPAYYDTGQFYFFRPAVLIEKNELVTDHTIGIEMSSLEVHDIDDEDDWDMAELKYARLHSADPKPASPPSTDCPKPPMTEVSSGAVTMAVKKIDEPRSLAARMALGGAQFGMDYGLSNKVGQVTAMETAEILRKARHAGIDMIDTAQAYGESEQLLGRIADHNWRIYTKIPAVPEHLLGERQLVAAWVRDQVSLSLDRLDRSTLTGLMLHHAQQLQMDGGQHIFAALRNEQDAGRIGEIGISIYEPDDLSSLRPEMRFDFVQGPLNIFDMRLAQSGWLSRLADDGCTFFARSAFLQGLLLMPAQERPPAFQRWDHLWQSWDRYLRESDISPVAACLRHLLRVRHVERIIVGVTGVQELTELLDSVDGELPPLPVDIRTSDPLLLNPSNWPKS
jgi:pseudaminic acid cytidylyltransferase